MTNKLTAASGTNQISQHNKYHAGGQALRKTIGSEYITSCTYNGIFMFSKAMHNYYSESTAHNRAEVYQPWKTRHKARQDVTLEQVSKHTLELLVNTLKEEVNTNIVLKDRIVTLERNIKATSIIMENKMLSNEKKHAVLDNAEKNRKDKHHREQLVKYSLIMFAGFLLFGLIRYL